MAILQFYHLFSHKNPDVSKFVSYRTILRNLQNFFCYSKSYLCKETNINCLMKTNIAAENRWLDPFLVRPIFRKLCWF